MSGLPRQIPDQLPDNRPTFAVATAAVKESFWARAVADGQKLSDGRIYIADSQVALARKYDLSAGTVAYHVRQLRQALSNDDGVVLDPSLLQEVPGRTARQLQAVTEAMAERWGRPHRHGLRLVDDSGSAPSVKDIAADLDMPLGAVQESLDELRSTGQLRQLDHHMILDASTEVEVPSTDPLEIATAALEAAAQALAAASRCISLLSAERELNASKARGIREVSAIRENTASADSVSSVIDRETELTEDCDARSRATRREVSANLPNDVDEALAPLLQLCDELGLDSHLDARGRSALERVDSRGLRAAALRLVPSVRAGTLDKRPLGVLIKKAEAGDLGFFSPLPSSYPRNVDGPQERSPGTQKPRRATDTRSPQDSTSTTPIGIGESLARLAAEPEMEIADQATIDALSPTELAQLDAFVVEQMKGRKPTNEAATAVWRRNHWALWVKSR